MSGRKNEREEEKGLVNTAQMGYDVFSPQGEREEDLRRAARNYGKNSVLKMLEKKLKLAKREKVRKVLEDDYAFVRDRL